MNKKVLAGAILAIISIVMSLISIIVCGSLGYIEIAIQYVAILFNFAAVFSSSPMMIILAIVYYLVVIVGVILLIVSLVRSIKNKIGLSWLNVGASVVLFAATFLSFPLFVALTSSTVSLLLIITISFAFGLILLCVAIGVMPKMETVARVEKKTTTQLEEAAVNANNEQPVVEEISVEEPKVVAAPTSDEVPSEVVNEEPMKEEVTEQPIDEEKSVEEKKPASKSSTPKRIYHISERKELNKWQIKFAGGTKALKMFNTQAEAIAYAKELIAKNGGSYRVHSRAGKMRKA